MKKYLPAVIICILIYFFVRCIVGFNAAAERQNQIYHANDNTIHP